MTKLNIGQEIGVRGDVRPGPFTDEYLVTIETVSGPISGFVSAKNVTDIHEGEGSIRAKIRELNDDTITVWISGSFFTTTGLAQISTHLAAANLGARN